MRINRWNTGFAAFVLGAFLIGSSLNAASIEENLRTIKSVDKEGKNHVAAIAAVKELTRGAADSLPALLNGMDDANPLAVNWLRGAIESIAERELKKTGKLPAAELEAFVNDKTHSAEARRLAYDWLIKVDSTAPDRLIPGMIHDSGSEFRRDAVVRLMAEATKAHEKGDQVEEKKLLRLALSGASDDDQVKAIVAPLRELGEKVDLQKHFGFISKWYLIGPFDNAGLKGFNTVYPPEHELNLKQKYQGKSGEVEWAAYSTDDEYGTFDIAKNTAPHKGAATYAMTTFVSDQDRNVEIRLGTPNAWKIWVNGKEIFARDEYHRGTMLDQYKVQTKLKSGPNVILLKICQNEQTEEWAQSWTFQLRVCDQSGIAVLPAAQTSASNSSN